MICKRTDKNKIEIVDIFDSIEIDKLKITLAKSKIFSLETKQLQRDAIKFKGNKFYAELERIRLKEEKFLDSINWGLSAYYSNLDVFIYRYENTFILPYNELI
jgi:hypothetical protein